MDGNLHVTETLMPLRLLRREENDKRAIQKWILTENTKKKNQLSEEKNLG
jgi:hypothetical protein